jgi:hypothetical protein
MEALGACGRVGACRARLIGGTKGKPSIGVQLDLDRPSVLIERIAGAGEVQPF